METLFIDKEESSEEELNLYWMEDLVDENNSIRRNIFIKKCKDFYKFDVEDINNVRVFFAYRFMVHKNYYSVKEILEDLDDNFEFSKDAVLALLSF